MSSDEIPGVSIKRMEVKVEDCGAVYLLNQEHMNSYVQDAPTSVPPRCLRRRRRQERGEGGGPGGVIEARGQKNRTLLNCRHIDLQRR
ncbi:hypothetical protein [Nonomuraea fuscirosea]|uniref:hypothetical protein n=1 Tax=Nonomuraea fuscirosea TaxID=1291556 RepID=UPI0034159D68